MKQKILIASIITISGLFVTGLFSVSAQKQSNKATNEKLEIIKPETKRDSQLEKAILKLSPDYKKFVQEFGKTSTYSYNKIDLNGDKKPEAIVRLGSTYFCPRKINCPTLIFRSLSNQYRLVPAEFYLTGKHFIVTNQKTNGWYNLGWYTEGRPKDYYGYLIFKLNSGRYTGWHKLNPNTKISGKALPLDVGIELRPV